MHLQTYWFILLAVSHVIAMGRRSLRTNGRRVSYEGAQVWRTRLKHMRQFVLIKKLTDDREISLWKLRPNHADFLVWPENKVDVDRRLRSQNLNHTVLLMNVQRQLDATMAPTAEWDESTLRLGHRLTFNFYPKLDVIDEYLSYIKDQYKSICTIETIGHSLENRSIQMAVVSNKNPRNKVILLNGGIHSREWVSVSSWLWLLNELVTKFDEQPQYVKNVDWYIIPVLNPDGYDYTHKVDRLWRKNRRPVAGVPQECYGVDLNRNFGEGWYVDGITTTEPCSETTSGSSAFSEPETVALRNVIKSKHISAFIDLHSFGQRVAYPWSASAEPPKNEKALQSIGEEMSMAIFNKYRKQFRVGNVYHSLYPASGSTIDYVYSSGVLLTFAIEARDTGEVGFLLGPEQLVDAAEELQAAAYSLADSFEPVLRSKDCHTWF